jgi:hypothetical protein
VSRKEYYRLKEEMKRSMINKRKESVDNRREKKIIIFDQSTMKI